MKKETAVAIISVLAVLAIVMCILFVNVNGQKQSPERGGKAPGKGRGRGSGPSPGARTSGKAERLFVPAAL